MIEVREAPPEHYGWMVQRAQLSLSPGFRALEALSGDRIVGMVGYDGWTQNSCSMHVAIDEPIAIRRLLKPSFGLVFDPRPRGLGMGVVWGSVLSTNLESLRFVGGPRGLGFRQVARLRDAWAKDVDLIVFEMRREQCRWLES